MHRNHRVNRAPALPIHYAFSQQELSEGNRAQLLPGGAIAFPAMLQAIAEAEVEVLLESYTLADDATGRAFLTALGEAAQRGVLVRLIVDGFGSLALPVQYLVELESRGAKTLVYRPVAPWRPHWGLFRRDHRKLLLVDGRVGFLGGLNLSDLYDARSEVGRSWRDLHLQLEGPSAQPLRHLFAATWNRHQPSDRRLPESTSVPAHPSGIAVQVLGNREYHHRSLIRRSFLHAARMARRSIWIANPYFIPDRLLARTLARAARHGVDVRILVPLRSDVRVCDLAARATFGHLLAAGVRIAEWHEGMVHAKAAVVDRVWATLGSYNFDRRSLRYNLEVMANLFDAGLAAAIAEELTVIFDRSTEIDRHAFGRRPLRDRIASWLAYQLRAWL